MQSRKQPYVQVNVMRIAFEEAGYPVKGNIGIKNLPGWWVNRAPKRRRK